MRNKSRFVFNITYRPVFLKLISILSEIHLLLTPDSKFEKLCEVPIIRFKKA